MSSNPMTPQLRFAKFLTLLGYACLLFSAIQVWEYWTYHWRVPDFSMQLQDWRFYNILFAFVMSAVSGVLLIHNPKLGIKTFHVLALIELCILIFFGDQLAGGQSAVIFYVVGLLFYWKLYAKIKKHELAEKDKNRPSN